MKLVHSLWSQPLLLTQDPAERTKKIITTLWCYASSVAYAKKHRIPIRLYADEAARKLLAFLPYDEVLPLSVPEQTPPCFWAAGKFAAYVEMKPGDIHIDGDVFLQSEAAVKLLSEASKKYDLLVQCIEDETNCYPKFYDTVSSVLNSFGMTYQGQPYKDFELAYNTGLIGFNDMQLRDEYVRQYNRSLAQIRQSADCVRVLTAAKTVPDVVLEQQKLYEISVNSRVFSLLGRGVSSVEYSRVLGYMHILSDAKWQNMDKIIGQLFFVSPEIFGKTADEVNKILLWE